MSTQITIHTKDGRIVHAISYSVGPERLTSMNPLVLGQGMPGGLDYGFFHVRDDNGWLAIPVSQVHSVVNPQPGAQT